MALGNIRAIGSKNNDPHAVIDDLEIKPEDVFAKTQAGVDEVRRQLGSTIPPKLRTVLMLIDGRTPFDSFKTTLKTYGDVTQLFSILRDLGLIVKSSASEGARERPAQRSGSSTPMGADTQTLREPYTPHTMNQIDAITQMPDMMARIAQAELAPGAYSTGLQRPPPVYAPPPQAYAPAPAPVYAPPPQQRAPVPEESRPGEIDAIKSNMIRDVSAILGADAGLVISKIQGCRTRDDLFASMMGIKKIISIYADRNAAEKFALRYQSLSF
jgi:cell wall assembly regulator SMI1